MSASPEGITVGHVGIYVRDLERMVAFYRDTLGFIVTDRSDRLCFMSRAVGQHHQLVLVSGRPADGPEMINQLSFHVGSLEDVRVLNGRLAAAEGVSEMRPLTHGNAWSVYFRDPEGNRVEFYADTPWYVPQPFVRPMDFTKPVETLHAETKAICEAQPGFLPVEQWQAGLARKLEAKGA